MNPLTLDSKAPTIPIEDYMYRENRFKMLTKSKPEEAARLLKLARVGRQAAVAAVRPDVQAGLQLRGGEQRSLTEFVRDRLGPQGSPPAQNGWR